MTWIQRAKVGDKVVAVVDFRARALECGDDWATLLDIEFPEMYVPYTIREIIVSPYGDDLVGFRLAEVLNMPCSTSQNGGWGPLRNVAEIAFDATGFRPLDDVADELSVTDRVDA